MDPLAMRRRAVRMPANRGDFPLHDRPRTNTAGGARVDVALEKRQVERAYELYAPLYDFIFDWIFAPGRAAAVKQCGIVPRDTVVEVGLRPDLVGQVNMSNGGRLVKCGSRKWAAGSPRPRSRAAGRRRSPAVPRRSASRARAPRGACPRVRCRRWTRARVAAGASR